LGGQIARMSTSGEEKPWWIQVVRRSRASPPTGQVAWFIADRPRLAINGYDSLSVLRPVTGWLDR